MKTITEQDPADLALFLIDPKAPDRVMITITEQDLADLERAGWVVTAGFWMADGHKIYLRRGGEERFAKVKPDEAGGAR
jgi:hypothetical protein